MNTFKLHFDEAFLKADKNSLQAYGIDDGCFDKIVL
jgi:hypothetical protein